MDTSNSEVETPEEANPSEGPSLFAGAVPIQVALNELRLRLLDLTGRNRLINFKHSPGKSLQFVHSSIAGVFNRLTEQNNRVAIDPLPEPARRDWVSRNGRLSRPEARDFAVKVGIDTSYTLGVNGSERPATTPVSSAAVRTLFYAEELGKHGRKIEREAKLAIEETGANTLYLVFGFLEYPESSDSDKTYQSPLICVPVSLSRVEEGQYSTFYLSYTGEEIADNLSLREKLKRDYSFNLPIYDDEVDASVTNYLDAVAQAVAQRPNWQVRKMMSVALLSFSNMLLVRDLDPDSWPRNGVSPALLEHPLVKQVFEGNVSAGESQYAEEYAIDDHPKCNLSLIYDADSSQHSALIDVLDGKNRVIEGPPGTGKSQTITNLIAAALQAGKKILFVAEKLAALEVVKSRLNQAGLAPFVLELHSNKTSKKRVLEDIAERINFRLANSSDLPDLLERHDSKRKELKAYAELLNTKVGNNLELTLHQVMWRAERHRMRAGDSAQAAQQLDFLAASRISRAEFESLCDRLRYLANQMNLIGTFGPSHPFWGFFPSSLKPEDDLTVQKVLKRFSLVFADFAKSTNEAANLLGGSNINMSAQSSEQILKLLESIAPADSSEVDYSLLPVLFSEADSQGTRSVSVLRDIQTRIKRIEEAEALVRTRLLGVIPASDAMREQAEQALGDMRVLGLAGLERELAQATCEKLQLFSRFAKAGIEKLRAIADMVPIPFDAIQSDIQALTAIVSVAAAASDVSLEFRHEGMRRPGVAAKLHEAAAELVRIQDMHQQLDAVLYLDALPSDSDLTTAISTLREGDTWYRIFQGRWRAAVRLHRVLERTKSKRGASERQRELELLLKLKLVRTTWAEDASLRAAAGPHFKGELTPMGQLLECSHWLDDSWKVLELAGVRRATFDPIVAERSAIVRNANQLSSINEAQAAIDALESLSKTVFASGQTRILKTLDSPELTLRIDTSEHAIAALQRATEFMTKHFCHGTTVDDGLSALDASAALPEMERQLHGHVEGLALFGEKFQGRSTNLETMFAAHTYGAFVKKANLPTRLEKVLISDDCVANHASLTSYTHGINKGWQAILEFTTDMTELGTFEPTVWVDPAGKSTSEYSQALADRTKLAEDNVRGLLDWAQYVNARTTARNEGLEAFVDALENGSVAGDKLEHSFVYRFYTAIAKNVFDRVPTLKQFSGSKHTSVRAEFAQLDKQIINLRGLQVARDCKGHARPPQGINGARVSGKTEMHLLELLIPQQRPRVPVRQILKRAGAAVQQLKPCFMMGPQAVAQFLEPGHLHFDIIVMDEASQLRPEQAIGAIARGSQLVVVGDPKQLPPTSFFSRMTPDDGDGANDGQGQMATSDAESILDVCISHFQPVRTLRWHYRSRHESLIAFSNHHFYRGNLLVFPSPYPKGRSLGLSYNYVSDGVYENQMNQVEARRMVDAAIEHMLHRPQDSLGMVTLNIKQRDLLSELLEERMRNLPQAIAFRDKWDAEGMGPFVKNLENVQGDERDCIIISTTFGKAKGTSVVRQSFGPISRDGGWRRLNVLFTRARKSVTVFSSMRPEDIVSDNRTPRGTRALRDYLEYARNGVLPMNTETELPPDSDFEVAVMDVLQAKGYEVTPQLGVAGFRIDIAVKHPVHRSGYLAAIECDGASYHTGVSVRDRDRIRQEILESLGWRGRIWRIWSTDWFRNPLAETGKLLQFLESLKDQPVPEEYLVPIAVEAPSVQVDVEQPVGVLSADDADQAEQLVFDEDEEEAHEIEVGDLVTYSPLDEPNNHIQVKLTLTQFDPRNGLVPITKPLGEVLLGATVGETVVLRTAGQTSQSFVIRSVAPRGA